MVLRRVPEGTGAPLCERGVRVSPAGMRRPEGNAASGVRRVGIAIFSLGNLEVSYDLAGTIRVLCSAP